jgi:hypothetical protein
MKPIKGKTYRLKDGDRILRGIYSGEQEGSPTIYKFFIFDDSDDRKWFSESEIIEEIDPKRRQRIHGKNRRPQNGDFSDYEVQCMVASYCRDITVGMTGWGVPFTVWVDLKGLAKFENGSLYKLEKPTCECEICDGRRAAHEELEECLDNLEVDDRVKVINPDYTLSFGEEGFISEIIEDEIMVNFTGGWRGWYNKEDVEKIK